MDIDIKNALDRAMSICDTLDKKDGQQIKKTLSKDIAAFIRYISTKGAEERYKYFSKLYLKDDNADDSDGEIRSDAIPESLKYLCAKQLNNPD